METTPMNLDDITLINGVGDREGKRLCVMSLTALIANEPHTDHPVCACPVLTSAAIRLNDASWWKSDAERTEVLKPLAVAMVGTRNLELQQKRARLFADRALRVWTPAALESAASVHPVLGHGEALRKHAAKLREDGSANAAANAAYAADAAAYVANAAQPDPKRAMRNSLLATIYEAIALT